eukprot:3118350-Alexandrium_andersonii.AAC.1
MVQLHGRLGTAWHGWAMQELVPRGAVWQPKAAQQSKAWPGMALYSTAQHSAALSRRVAHAAHCPLHA